jgi:hypothetical protein
MSLGVGPVAESEEPINTNKKSTTDRQNGAEKSNSIRGIFLVFTDFVRKTFTTATGSTPNIGTAVRLLFVLGGAIIAALFLLWIVDKVVFYYLTKNYVDEVANVFDLNEHLANALILGTFVVAVFFGRFIWSFSRQKRLIGIAGISTLLIGHSLVLWYGTRANYFDPSGQAIKCYVLTRDGKVTYGEHPGIDPATGRLCRPVTAEMLERLKQYALGKRPQQILDTNPTFFDPRTGEPIVWYYRSKDEIEIFDLMGFHPDTGEELIPISKEIVEQWKSQTAKIMQHIPKLINPEKYVFFDPRNGSSRAWYWRDANGAYEFYDSSGFHPRTGDPLKIVTKEDVDAWRRNAGIKTPQIIDPNSYSFFDPATGLARVWYWRSADGKFEFYDAAGFHPRTGDKLLLVTRDIVSEWQKQSAARPVAPKADNTSLGLESLAGRFLVNHFRISQGAQFDVLNYVQDTYAPEVDYYGDHFTKAKILEDQRRYTTRWPERSFEIMPEKTRIACDSERAMCDISATVHFQVYNPATLKSSSGITTYDVRVIFSGNTASIVSENGAVISR